jgi:uncharacterized protein YciI
MNVIKSDPANDRILQSEKAKVKNSIDTERWSPRKASRYEVLGLPFVFYKATADRIGLENLRSKDEWKTLLAAEKRIRQLYHDRNVTYGADAAQAAWQQASRTLIATGDESKVDGGTTFSLQEWQADFLNRRTALMQETHRVEAGVMPLIATVGKRFVEQLELLVKASEDEDRKRFTESGLEAYFEKSFHTLALAQLGYTVQAVTSDRDQWGNNRQPRGTPPSERLRFLTFPD